MERKLLKKRDAFILLALLLLALLFWIFTSNSKGGTVEIWVDGKLLESHSLGAPFEMTLDNGVTIIGDGKEAWFDNSDCKDRVCINTGKLSVSGEWAACLPNETVIKIVGSSELDVVN